MPSPTILDNLEPSDIGLPPKFTVFRDIQREMAQFCLFGPHNVGPTNISRRFSCCGAPAGAGKTVSAHAIGRLSGKKYVVLTATKQLQQQYENDGFPASDLRGKDNYICRETDRSGTEWSCKEGGEDQECRFSGKPGCTYFDKVTEAKKARGVVTNYAYWLNARSTNQTALESPGEPVGLLICDEAHLAMRSLASFLGTWVGNEDLHRWAGQESRTLIAESKGAEWGRITGRWVDALEMVILGAKVKQSKIVEEYRTEAEAARKSNEHRKLGKLVGGLERVCGLGRDNNWLWRHTRNGIAFDCVWPGKYAERYLWSGVGQIVLMSGTLRPKAMHLLNVKATDYHFKEWPRQFPAHLSPVWWVPTGRMGRKASEGERLRQIELLDMIGKEWGHKKGVIHTPSYVLAEWLQSNSPWGRHMMINERGEATTMLDRFRAAKPPAMLVSPSYTTGTDLADESCEWIWVPKLPYPDRSDPVVMARVEDDPDYYTYETAQTLEQECLRGSRHEKDRCTTIISDDSVGNFRNFAKRHFSGWYRIDKWEKGGIPTCRE